MKEKFWALGPIHTDKKISDKEKFLETSGKFF